MPITIHEPKSREEWLNLRLKDVTASEVASLFGTGYMSRYELWHIKSGYSKAFFDNERMRWGRKLEKAIAETICEDDGNIMLQDRPIQYFSDSDARAGATPDFFIDHPTKGTGLLQIKNVDAMIFKQKWSKPQDGGEAPDYIEMQVQQEMMLTGCKWAKIGVLVGGNQCYVYDREFYPTVASGLVKEIAGFWKSVEEKNEPKPDFLKDSDFIIEMYSAAQGGKSIDLTGDERVDTLLRGYDDYAKRAKDAEDMRQSYKAELLTLIGDAENVLTSAGKIAAKEVKGSDGTLITPEMVGQRYGARSGYRGFRVTLNKEDK